MMRISQTFTRFLVCFLLLSHSFLASPRPVSASPQRLKRVDLIISGGTVVTMDKDRRVIEDGAVAVAGGRIVAIGRRADIARQYAARDVVDATGRAVIPGLINGHTHVP